MAGRFTDEAWAATAELRAAIDTLPFIRELTAGTLARPRFQTYITQDALYLGQFSRALAIAAAKAPDTAALQSFLSWAIGAVAVETELHRTYLAAFGVDPGHGRDHRALSRLPRLYELAPRHRAPSAVGGDRRRPPAVLLDLLGCRRRGLSPDRRRQPLPRLDRHLCRRGFWRGGPGDDRDDRSGRDTGAPRADACRLRAGVPLRVSLLGRRLPPARLAGKPERRDRPPGLRALRRQRPSGDGAPRRRRLPLHHPWDNRLDRAAYFTRCWRDDNELAGFDFVHLSADGDRVFVAYEGRRKDGKPFRNTEIVTVRDGKLVEVEVYFGWSLPHDAPPGGSRDP